jgi:hypothetical protein
MVFETETFTPMCHSSCGLTARFQKSTMAKSVWVTGDASTGLSFTPFRVYHLLTRGFEDLPFAKDQRFIQSFIDKYFATPIGNSNSTAIPEYLNVVLSDVARFINEHLPRSIQVLIQYISNGRSLVVKIAWAALVETKGLVREETDAEKLEREFNTAIDLYSPGYLGANYPIIDSNSRSNPWVSAPTSGITPYGEQRLHSCFFFSIIIACFFRPGIEEVGVSPQSDLNHVSGRHNRHPYCSHFQSWRVIAIPIARLLVSFVVIHR